MNTKAEIKENIQKALSELDGRARLLLATKTSHLRHIEHMEGCPWNRGKGQALWVRLFLGQVCQSPGCLPEIPWE